MEPDLSRLISGLRCFYKGFDPALSRSSNPGRTRTPRTTTQYTHVRRCPGRLIFHRFMEIHRNREFFRVNVLYVPPERFAWCAMGQCCCVHDTDHGRKFVWREPPIEKPFALVHHGPVKRQGMIRQSREFRKKLCAGCLSGSETASRTRPIAPVGFSNSACKNLQRTGGLWAGRLLFG